MHYIQPRHQGGLQAGHEITEKPMSKDFDMVLYFLPQNSALGKYCTQTESPQTNTKI
jgi:hypothetical protein